MGSIDTLTPPLSTNASGEPRRVGVEIELDKLTVEQICDEVRAVFGGDTRFKTEFEATVETESGDFEVLVDAKWALKLGRSTEDTADEEALSDKFLKAVADMVVPLEIATPPLPIASLPKLDDVVEGLGRRGGQGTKDSVLNAFGVHFNPELPGLDPELIVRYLQAFVVLRDWLLQKIEVDFSRRATPFIDRFPSAYATLVLDPAYEPTQPELIDDYIDHNPTRNRALDMLPLFAHLDEERVRAALPDEKINARPTFHYRMGNSRVGEQDWSITTEWLPWLEVEKLVVDRELLDMLGADYREILASPVDALFTDWGSKVAERIGVVRG